MKFLIVLALAVVAASAAPLTHDEAELLKNAWNQVKHHEVEILEAVFKAHPDIQARFPKFAGKSLESVKDSADFALHATRIVSAISEIISLSGNAATLPAVKTIVNQLAVEHKNRGIPKEQFNEFRAAVTEYLSTHSSWGDNVAAVWNHALDNVYAIVFANLDGHPVV